jgi:uncharacterized membrane protein YphA (DoxX/SURF4 family)
MPPITLAERSIRVTPARIIPSAGTTTAQMDAFQPPESGWSFAHRVVFRFVFSFLVLCNFPFPFSSNPGSVYEIKFFTRMWFAVARWMGIHIMRVPAMQLASWKFLFADSVQGCVVVGSFGILAAFATIIWTSLDRKRAEYQTLHEWLRIYIRYALAFAMLYYGMDKVFALQFNMYRPNPRTLAMPLGEYWPMELLWTFMGYSKAYTIFAGTGEVIGALLLFFRRTTTLGALILCGVMANVVAMDFSYGVTVRILASLLLAEAIFLVTPDASRLLNVLVLNRATPAANLESPFRKPWIAKSRLAVNAAIVIFALYWATGPAIQAPRKRGNFAKSPFYGLYQVESFKQNGKPLPASDSNWRRVIFEHDDYFTALKIDDSTQGFATDFDTVKHQVTIVGWDDATDGEDKPSWKSDFSYSWTDAEHVELRGNFRNQPAVIDLRKVNLTKLPLVSH